MADRDKDNGLNTETDMADLTKVSGKEFDYDYVEYMYGVDLRVGKDAPVESKIVSGGADDKKAENSTRMELYDWVQCIVAALLCGILIFVFIGRVIGVDGTSMIPTLHHGDQVVMSKLFFTPKYGDVVVLRSEAYGDSPLVKRVIATAGQTIDINFTTGEVTVDGRVLEEDYIADITTLRGDFDGPVTVPDGCVFVMGDNRNASSDSRSDKVGMVDIRNIFGKVYLVLIPAKESDGVRYWSRIGLV